jgi:hypothetical protein
MAWAVYEKKEIRKRKTFSGNELLGNELYIYCPGHILALFGSFWGKGLHVYILSNFYNHACFIMGKQPWKKHFTNGRYLSLDYALQPKFDAAPNRIFEQQYEDTI